jgi:hypothetical protein
MVVREYGSTLTSAEKAMDSCLAPCSIKCPNTANILSITAMWFLSTCFGFGMTSPFILQERLFKSACRRSFGKAGNAVLVFKWACQGPFHSSQLAPRMEALAGVRSPVPRRCSLYPPSSQRRFFVRRAGSSTYCQFRCHREGARLFLAILRALKCSPVAEATDRSRKVVAVIGHRAEVAQFLRIDLLPLESH